MFSPQRFLGTALAIAVVASGALAAGAQARPAIDPVAPSVNVSAPARVDSMGKRPATAPDVVALPVEVTPITTTDRDGTSVWVYAAIAASALLALGALVLLVRSYGPLEHHVFPKRPASGRHV